MMLDMKKSINIGVYTNSIPIISATYPNVGGAIMKTPYVPIVIIEIPTVGSTPLIEDPYV